MKILVIVGFLLSPLAAFGTQCGSGSEQEYKNLKTNHGAVVIDGVVRYGASAGCGWDSGRTPMYRYSAKRNTINLFHCAGGQVYWAEQDNINFVCENLGPDRSESPERNVERALREYGGRQYALHRGKPTGATCRTHMECASNACIPQLAGMGYAVCQ